MIWRRIVFCGFIALLPAFRGEALVSTYLYRIVVNVAQDEIRRRHREERPLTSLADEAEDWGDRLRHPSRNAEELLLEKEFAAGVERALEELSAIQRTVLVLYHQEERTYEEIAAVLGMPIGTVRTHLHRGRARLRELIGTDAGQMGTGHMEPDRQELDRQGRGEGGLRYDVRVE